MLAPYNRDIADLLHDYQVSPDQGLTTAEVHSKLATEGYNEFQEQPRQSFISIFFSQFKNAITFLLVAAALISYLFHDYTESIAIVAVLAINATIGFILEIQAIRSMEALKKMDKLFAHVIREGKTQKIEARTLVPGDILLLEAGDLITADARLISNVGLHTDESVLTGESLPIEKQLEPLEGTVIQGDRSNMVFKGTIVTNGNAVALVTGTGSKTAVGEISELVQQADSEEIPLNRKLDQFSKTLIWLTIALVIPFVILGYFKDQDLYLMVETAIALAVAAIPEGLPIVATIALARGMLNLAKHQVIVKKLAAVETLGEVNVIMTDKTGTLTRNELFVDNLVLANEHNYSLSELKKEKSSILESFLKVATLCNNASFESEDEKYGDPLEVALLHMVNAADSELVLNLRKNWKEVQEIPFDSERRIMATLHQNNGELWTSVKGATSEVLKACNRIQTDENTTLLDEERQKYWTDKTNELSAAGLKVIALAYDKPSTRTDDFAQNLIFLGLVGFLDLPREGIEESIDDCYEAGIKVVMVTGDHPETAQAIAKRIHLVSGKDINVVHGQDFDNLLNSKELDDPLIFSRVSPRQKLELVEYYQKKGWIVGMTGDGVNDAPALRKADIGVAMGLRGTQVAEEAADMVLQDDSFTSIVRAIRQGRIIFNNIKNFVIYLLSCNLSEILVVASAAFSNIALPLLPLQILFLNLVTDVFPALALGMGKGDASIMSQKPRNPKEPILTRSNWFSISSYALILTLSVMAVFLYGMFIRGFSDEVSNTIAFFTLAFAQLVHPLNLITRGDNWFKNEIFRNPHLWGAVLFCTVLLLLVHFIEPFSALLLLQNLTGEQWLLVVIGSIAPVAVIRLLKMVRVVV